LPPIISIVLDKMPAAGHDGKLRELSVIAHDAAGTIWRITYTGDRQRVDRR
jgi:hypothetical protein